MSREAAASTMIRRYKGAYILTRAETNSHPQLRNGAVMEKPTTSAAQAKRGSWPGAFPRETSHRGRKVLAHAEDKAHELQEVARSTCPRRRRSPRTSGSSTTPPQKKCVPSDNRKWSPLRDEVRPDLRDSAVEQMPRPDTSATMRRQTARPPSPPASASWSINTDIGQGHRKDRTHNVTARRQQA